MAFTNPIYLAAVLFLCLVPVSLSSDARPVVYDSDGWRTVNECTPKYSEYAIELALLKDQSRSFAQVDSTGDFRGTWYPYFTNYIVKTYPKSKFGFTTFNDWAARTWWAGSYCYKFFTGLTDVNSCFKSMDSMWSQPGGDAPQSSLAGISLTVTEKQMGWTPSSVLVGKGGERIRKVILLATNAAPLGTGAKRLPAMKGDSTDSCNNDEPTPEMVGKTLRSNNVLLVVLATGADTVKIWKSIGIRMNAGVLVYDRDSASPSTVFDAVRTSIEEYYCFSTTTTKTPASGGSDAGETTQWVPNPMPRPRTKPASATTTQKKPTAAGAGLAIGAATGGIALVGAASYAGYKYIQKRGGLVGESSPMDEIDIYNQSDDDESDYDEDDREMKAEVTDFA